MALLLVMTACGQQSALQKAAGVSAEQNREIEGVLESAGIEYEMVNEARHNRPQTDIPDGCAVFNLIDSEANNYFLVLDENGDAVLLLDSDEIVLWSGE